MKEKSSLPVSRDSSLGRLVHVGADMHLGKSVEHNIKMFPAEPHKIGEMEFYLLEDLDFHLVVFHPYRALLHMCGREPADSGRFAKTRLEEDSEVRRKESEVRRKRDDEVRKGISTGRILEDLRGGMAEEGEGDRIRRLMGRGTGEGHMDVDEGVFQICM